jgi:hypothetical protein
MSYRKLINEESDDKLIGLFDDEYGKKINMELLRKLLNKTENFWEFDHDVLFYFKKFLNAHKSILSPNAKAILFDITKEIEND